MGYHRAMWMDGDAALFGLLIVPAILIIVGIAWNWLNSGRR